MRWISVPKGRWGYRRRWRARGRRGVVSVIGAILSLLFFYALFGIFLTQYVPLWMSENEAAFTGSAQTSLATLKSNIDLQTALRSPPVYSTPFTLASQGIPLIAQPTTGQLTFTPRTAGVFVSLTVTPGPAGQSHFVQNVSLGSLSVGLPNRYYPQQTFQLADDAVVQSQGPTAQVLAYPPLLSVNSSGTSSGVSAAIVQLFGNSTQITSTGTVEVYSHYLFSQATTIAAPNVTVTLKIGTLYPCAWWTFLNKTVTSALELGLPASAVALSPSASPCATYSAAAGMVEIVFTGLTSFTLVQSGISLVLGVGQE